MYKKVRANIKGYEYSRTKNPTRFAYEQCVANLESGQTRICFCIWHGCNCNYLEIIKPGDHVIACDDVYGGTYRFLKKCVNVRRIEFSFVDLTVMRKFDSNRPKTRMIWVETPTNPMLKLVDLRKIAKLRKSII